MLTERFDPLQFFINGTSLQYTRTAHLAREMADQGVGRGHGERRGKADTAFIENP